MGRGSLCAPWKPTQVPHAAIFYTMTRTITRCHGCGSFVAADILQREDGAPAHEHSRFLHFFGGCSLGSYHSPYARISSTRWRTSSPPSPPPLDPIQFRAMDALAALPREYVQERCCVCRARSVVGCGVRYGAGAERCGAARCGAVLMAELMYVV